MGHHLTGLVAASETLERIADEHDLKPPTRLDFGDLAFLPLDNDNLHRLPGVSFSEVADKRFEFLSASFMQWLRRWSIGRDLCYIETDYFGGTGGQAALHFRDGALVFGPASGGFGMINAALAGLGVPDLTALDAFDATGLFRYRSNDAARAANDTSRTA